MPLPLLTQPDDHADGVLHAGVLLQLQGRLEDFTECETFSRREPVTDLLAPVLLRELLDPLPPADGDGVVTSSTWGVWAPSSMVPGSRRLDTRGPPSAGTSTRCASDTRVEPGATRRSRRAGG